MNNLVLATSFTDNQMLLLLGLFVGLMGIIMFLLIFIFIIQIFARWRVFAKMGIPSWKCLIPIYSDYCLWGGVWSKSVYLVDLLLSIVCYGMADYITKFVKANPNTITTTIGILAIVVLVLAIILLVLQIRFVNYYSRAFGHGFGFTLGLLFFPSIFELIIGFGSSQYVGKQA